MVPSGVGNTVNAMGGELCGTETWNSFSAWNKCLDPCLDPGFAGMKVHKEAVVK